MTTDNPERIKAASEKIARMLKRIADCDHGNELSPTIDQILTEHFGESAPEQKEGPQQHLYTADEVSHGIFRVTGMGVETLGAILREIDTAHVANWPVAPSVDTNAAGFFCKPDYDGEDAADAAPQEPTCAMTLAEAESKRLGRHGRFDVESSVLPSKMRS